jgi:hypothetical protein
LLTVQQFFLGGHFTRDDDRTLDEVKRQMERFAREVMPHYRETHEKEKQASAG